MATAGRPAPRREQRFVLLDPSLTGQGGHYFDYAREVLTAAEASGLVPLLVAHQTFDDSGTLGKWLAGRFRLDYWGRASAADPRGAGTAPDEQLLRLGLRVSRRVPRLLRVALQGARRVRRARSFAEDTARLIRRLELRQGDVVFLPNVSESDLLGFSWILDRHVLATPATWHLLLRRDPRTPPTDPPIAGSLRRALARLSGGARSGQVFCYSDTDHLAGAYTALGAVKFTTLPIPVAPTLRESDARASLRPGRLAIGYLGDARLEKGFHHLPSLAKQLNARLPTDGRPQFVVQAYGAALDPSTRSARAHLSRLPRDQIELIDAPLDATQYRALLRRLDILLVPYDQRAYAARSSGVFAEGLCAGIPPLVPAGTWMADQLQAAHGAWHAEVLRLADVLGSASVRRPTPSSWSVPPGTTHVLMHFVWPAGVTAGAYAEVELSTQIVPNVNATRHRTMLGRASSEQCTMLAPVAPGVTVARARVRGDPHLPRGLELRAIDFLSIVGPTAIGSVGTIYCGLDQLAEGLLELVEHYPHYRSTAAAFAERWSDYHRPANLVASLLSSAAPRPGAARVICPR